MAIFTESGTRSLPLFREPDVDFEWGGLVADEQKRPVILEGLPALAVWVRKALDVGSARFAHPAHTAAYGNEFQALLGSSRDVAENRMREMVRACLTVNPYITGVDGFTFTHTGSGLHAAFRVGTVYGDILGEREVDIR